MIGELGRLRPARLLAIAVFLVVLALPAAARAAVVVGATNSASSTTGTVSFPLTVAAGNDRLLVIGVSRYEEHGVNRVTYGGQVAVRRGSVSEGLTGSDIWTLTAPNVGTATVTIELGDQGPIVGGATAFSGVDQGDPITSFQTSNSNVQSNVTEAKITNTAPGDAMFGVLATGHFRNVGDPNPVASADGITATKQWGRTAGVFRGAAGVRKGSALPREGIRWSWSWLSADNWANSTQALIGLRATGTVTPPYVESRPPRRVKPTSAELLGDTLNFGGAPTLEQGFLLCRCANPVLGAAGVTHVPSFTRDFLNDFFSDATGLLPETTYTYRAYSSNRAGRMYGEPISFTTPANRAPSANAGGAYSVVEGSGIALDARASTDPDADALTYAWDLDGDGAFDDATGATPSLTGAQLTALGLGDGPSGKSVRVRVSDGIASADSAAATFTVTNAAPSGSLANDGPTVEGARARVSLTAVTDPSAADTAAGVRYAYDFDNNGVYDVGGTTYATASTTANALLPAALTADGPATRTVTAALIDKDGGVRTLTTTVTVTNQAPTATVGNVAVSEGSPATISVTNPADTATDLAAGLRYAYDFGDDGTWDIGSASYAGAVTAATATLPAALTADGPVQRAVRVAVIDKDGAVTERRATVTVENVAPQAALADVTADEGSIARLTLTGARDASPEDVAAGLRYEWDPDGDGTFTAGDATVDVPAGGGPATRTIRGAILDRDGGRTEYGATLTVRNVAPTAELSGPATVPASGAVALVVRIADAGADALTATLDWGDGATTTLTRAGEETIGHAYASAGAKTITLVVTDADGASSAIARHTLTVASTQGGGGDGGGGTPDPANPPAGGGEAPPTTPGTVRAQRITGLAVTPGCVRTKSRKPTVSVRFAVDLEGSVELNVRRVSSTTKCPRAVKPGSAGRRVSGVLKAYKTSRIAARAGANTVKLSATDRKGKRLRPGTYELTVKSGGATVRVRFAVRPA
jgi:hypothetical protein